MKRSAANQGDFKRLKAKVGKKAPKKLNVTDTTFRTVGLKVHSESQANSLGKEKSKKDTIEANILSTNAVRNVVSTKVGGKPLSELTSQLSNHPSPAVRKSAVTGIRDIISKITTSYRDETISSDQLAVKKFFILGVIEISISVLARLACIDADDGVREMGRAALKDLFMAVSSMHSHVDEDFVLNNQYADRIIRPFVPLISAYILSALNSMEIDIRKDAVLLSGSCFQLFPEAFGDHTERMIPAFIKLLKLLPRSTVGKSSAKKKKKGNMKQMQSSRTITLKAIISLFKAFKSSSNKKNNNLCNRIEGFRPQKSLFVDGNMGSNSLILFRKINLERPVRFEKSNNSGKIDLEHVFERSLGLSGPDEKNISHDKLDERLSDESRIDLLQKLRDYWVELMQSGTLHGSCLNIRLGYVEEAISIITCTELLFEQFCREPLSVEVKQTERLPSIWSKVRHLISGMLSTFLQCFPVKDDSGNFENHHIYNSLNIRMSSLMTEIGKALNQENWIEPVFLFIFDQLEDITNEREKYAGQSLVALIEELLLRRHLLSEDARVRLLVKVEDTFFIQNSLSPTLHRNTSDTIIKSLFFQNVAQMIAKVVVEQGGRICNSKIKFSRILVRILRAFPSLVCIYEDGYPEVTKNLLGSILHVTRYWCSHIYIDSDKIEHEDEFMSEFICHIRQELCLIFNRNLGVKKKNSIFEVVSVDNQCLIIHLIGILKKLSTTCLKNISEAVVNLDNCGDKHTDTITLLYETLQNIRKSISFSDYLNFLVCSTGLNKKNNKKCQGMFAYDDVGKRFSTAVINCGGFKVLPSLTPILVRWLQVNGDETVEMYHMIRIRVAISLVASCMKDLFSTCSIFDKIEELPELKESIIVATLQGLFLNVLFYNTSLKKTSSDFVDEKLWIKQSLSPILSLLRSNPAILLHIFDSILSTNFRGSKGANKCAKTMESVVKSLLYIVDFSSRDLAFLERNKLQTKSIQMLSHIQNECLEFSESSTSLMQLSQKLGLSIKILIGPS